MIIDLNKPCHLLVNANSHTIAGVLTRWKKSSAVAEIDDCLATIDMGCSAPFRGGGLGPHLTQCHLGRGLPPYQVAS